MRFETLAIEDKWYGIGRAADHAIGADIFSVGKKGYRGIGSNQLVYLIGINTRHICGHDEDARHRQAERHRAESETAASVVEQPLD